MPINMFETATKNKYRFPYKGLVSAEDLWDMTPAQLDSIYKALKKDAVVSTEESLLTLHSENAQLNDKIELVKYVFSIKQQEADERKAAAANAAKRKQIMEILERKQDDALSNMSEADLKKMLDELS